MGFRGEALASIAAVAQVELKTRRAEDEVGTKIFIEGSVVKSQEPCQSPVGTSIMVKNLFYNVPARRNFLKSAATETKQIIDEFTRVAMAFPLVAFKLTNNNTVVFNLDSGKFKQRIVGLLGSQFESKLVPVEEPTDVVNIKGFIASPDMASKTRGNQYFFVNNRFIKSAYLNFAVTTAYKDLISKDEFPAFVLFIDIDPNRVDINVHPTKQEIKFEDDRIVYSFVSAAIRHSLNKYSIAPSLDFTLHPEIQQLDAISKPFSESKQQGVKKDYLFQSFTEKGKAHFLEKRQEISNWKELYKVQSEFQLNVEPQKEELQAIEHNENLIPLKEEQFLQNFIHINGGYILATTPNGFILIDQHLAHQRILYETLQKTKTEKWPIQKCLIPITIELSPADAVLLNSIKEDLLDLGFEVEPFGNQTFIIQGVPSDVRTGHERESIEKLLESLKHEHSDLKLDKREKLIRTLVMQKAIFNSKKISELEMKSLYEKLFACENSKLSPLGKKIWIEVNAAQIAQWIQHA